MLSDVSPETLSEFAYQRIAQHRFRPCGRPARSGAYLHHVAFGSMSLSNLGFGSETLIEGSESLDHYYIQVVTSGRLDVAFFDRTYAVDANSIAIINPFHRVQLYHSPECRVVIVRIQRDALQNHPTQLLGRTTRQPVEFSPVVLRDQPRIGSLVRTIDHLCREVEDPYSLVNTGRLFRNFEGLLAETFFSTVPHSHTNKVEQAMGVDGPECLMRAERYIEANYAHDISLADIVEASGTSQRSLYKAFKDYRNATPVAHLKWHRLRAARYELETPGPASRTVADVAMSVGMPHLGNFAADYRQQFGELPSETLRRHPRGSGSA